MSTRKLDCRKEVRNLINDIYHKISYYIMILKNKPSNVAYRETITRIYIVLDLARIIEDRDLFEQISSLKEHVIKTYIHLRKPE